MHCIFSEPALIPQLARLQGCDGETFDVGALVVVAFRPPPPPLLTAWCRQSASTRIARWKSLSLPNNQGRPPDGAFARQGSHASASGNVMSTTALPCAARPSHAVSTVLRRGPRCARDL